VEYHRVRSVSIFPESYHRFPMEPFIDHDFDIGLSFPQQVMTVGLGCGKRPLAMFGGQLGALGWNRRRSQARRRPRMSTWRPERALWSVFLMSASACAEVHRGHH